MAAKTLRQEFQSTKITRVSRDEAYHFEVIVWLVEIQQESRRRQMSMITFLSVGLITLEARDAKRVTS